MRRTHNPCVSWSFDQGGGNVDGMDLAVVLDVDSGSGDAGDGEGVVGAGYGAIERNVEWVVSAGCTVEGESHGVGAGGERECIGEGEGGEDGDES